MKVGQATRNVLDRFRAAVGGIGRIYGPYKNAGKGWFEYRAMGKYGVQVLELIRPYLTDITLAKIDAKYCGYRHEERYQAMLKRRREAYPDSKAKYAPT
jgi:hypothetical protein